MAEMNSKSGQFSIGADGAILLVTSVTLAFTGPFYTLRLGPRFHAGRQIAIWMALLHMGAMLDQTVLLRRGKPVPPRIVSVQSGVEFEEIRRL